MEKSNKKKKLTPKNIYIIAGPNGAGKTTFANAFIPATPTIQQFVNADLIAYGLSPFAPEKEALWIHGFYTIIRATRQYCWVQEIIMQNKHSSELKELLTNVEAALIQAGQNARKLAEQTGTKLIIVEKVPANAQSTQGNANTEENTSKTVR